MAMCINVMLLLSPGADANSVLLTNIVIHSMSLHIELLTFMTRHSNSIGKSINRVPLPLMLVKDLVSHWSRQTAICASFQFASWLAVDLIFIAIVQISGKGFPWGSMVCEGYNDVNRRE